MSLKNVAIQDAVRKEILMKVVDNIQTNLKQQSTSLRKNFRIYLKTTALQLLKLF